MGIKEENRITAQHIIVVAAVIFSVLILIALIANVIKLSALNRREKELSAQIAAAEQLVRENSAEIDYKRSDEYIDNYAREHLNMQGKDDITFIAGKK